MIALLLYYNIYVTLIFVLLLHYNIYVTLIFVSLLYYNICVTSYIFITILPLNFPTLQHQNLVYMYAYILYMYACVYIRVLISICKVKYLDLIDSLGFVLYVKNLNC